MEATYWGQSMSQRLQYASKITVQGDANVLNYWTADISHNRPKPSPYLSRFIKVRFGNSSDEYMVPEDLIRTYHKLSSCLDAISTSDALDLQEADSQVGHTFVHFLYSRTYEFLDHNDLPTVATRVEEFEQGILVFSAATIYDIPELAQFAKDEVGKAAVGLGLSRVIKHARKHFDSIPRWNKWLLNFVKSLMEERLEKDANTFLKGNFFEGFGKHETFDPHLCRFIVEIYEKKILHISETFRENPESNKEESIHENGVYTETPDPEPDTGADDVPEPEDLEAASPAPPTESPAEPSSPIEVAPYSPPTWAVPPPDDSGTVEPQFEDQPKENTAEPEFPSPVIENPDSLEQNSEIAQILEEHDSWGLLRPKKSKKGKKRRA